MTAWVKRGTKEVVGIITDFTDNEYVVVSHPAVSRTVILQSNRLTEFNKKLVSKYSDIPFAETKCGYACSDQ